LTSRLSYLTYHVFLSNLNYFNLPQSLLCILKSYPNGHWLGQISTMSYSSCYSCGMNKTLLEGRLMCWGLGFAISSSGPDTVIRKRIARDITTWSYSLPITSMYQGQYRLTTWGFCFLFHLFLSIHCHGSVVHMVYVGVVA
jgi:hypothetical protein